MKMEVSERILELLFFDYVGCQVINWMNNGKFDGGQLTDSEKSLRDFYKRFNFSSSSSALMGDFQEIQT
jgi:hypothetical protein